MPAQHEFQAVRLQKVIAQRGLCSRRQADSWIREGRVKVNGHVAQLGQLVLDDDAISVDGAVLSQRKAPKVYWMLHKPDLTLVSTTGQADKNTIYDLPCLRKIPFPVSYIGRLDFRTEGLLLLSNDGEFVHQMSHPRFKLKRTYWVVLNRKLTSVEYKTLRQGFSLEDGPVTIDHLKLLTQRSLGASRGYAYELTVSEGRNRLVRRIFSHFGAKVCYLKRVAYGNLWLPTDLKAGTLRPLTKEELRLLKQL